MVAALPATRSSGVSASGCGTPGEKAEGFTAAACSTLRVVGYHRSKHGTLAADATQQGAHRTLARTGRRLLAGSVRCPRDALGSWRHQPADRALDPLRRLAAVA